MRTHGTESMYRAGCRCEDCRQARHDVGVKRYEVKKRRPPEPKPVFVPRVIDPESVERWQEASACGEVPEHMTTSKWLAWWNPEKPSATNWTPRREFCQACTVRAQCLDEALTVEKTQPRRVGMRGGFTPAERAELADKLARREV